MCLRRNKRRTIAQVRYYNDDVFPFCTCNVLWNVPYKRSHKTEKTAMSKSRKKTPTAIGVSVKYNLCYFFSVVLQPNWGLGWLYVEVARSHRVRHRHSRLDASELVTSSSHRPLLSQHKTTRLMGSYPRTQEGKHCRSTTQNPRLTNAA